MDRVFCEVAFHRNRRVRTPREEARKVYYSGESMVCQRCRKCLEMTIGDPVPASLKQSGAPQQI